MDTKITVHLAILFSLIAVLYRHFNARDIQFQFLVLAIFTVLSYFFTLYLIPIVKEYCLKADIWGKDLNKGTPDKIPESLGIAVGTVYLICVVCFQPVFHSMVGICAAERYLLFTKEGVILILLVGSWANTMLHYCLCV
jgi:UDP-N-acetylmuramyl pentapeptide phosphotransferase/UDP-N-acetylglucosamine-1-phosphate transferase